MRGFCLCLLTLFALAPGLVCAETRVWLIGGGNTLGNSQGQIEENVRWLQQLFEARGISPRTYYTHGGADEVDVVYFAPEEERDPLFEPLLRVYGKGLAYARKTRRNSLANVLGTTEKSQLSASLKADFASVDADDSVLLVYNGHGEIDSDDTLNNSLKLWGDTHMDIGELSELVDQINPEADFRFVLTQCFAGSFNSLIYEDPRSDQLATQNRCGFLAESDRREAEGCDLGTNQAEFRDYTTFFFAALQGLTRLGEPIPLDQLDLDADGRVSFREAHLYTLRNALSSDLSRSTSDMFLEQWEPWYMRWSSQGKMPDNDYSRVARHLANTYQMPLSGPGLGARRQQLGQQEFALATTQSAIKDQITMLQEQIQQRMEPLTRTYPEGWREQMGRLNEAQLEELRQALIDHPDYPKLRAAQTQMETTGGQLLDINRDKTQVDKMLRMLRLARLELAFERFANQTDKAARARLLSCENGTL